ncbi:hypothetical protein AUA35_07735 [Salmonella enterica subsp. enterica serovar Worthington]|uniref:Uncharacterized protein n=3 Tax=Salmonella enterica TaxID=28901 RepID=A0A5T3ZJN8_SALER|nr:hypothetical protein A9G52_04910 [Salmonella enterica subsp. enterica serovar Worthington]AZI90156.1 hypothetical protein EIL74_01605 [Salmonella enterica subsp. enterica serovar Senftenberg]EAA0438973.1 hypothetical protein [Salmonella enterica]EBV8193190.1 hypothetical protein [Salmonella enterica subsp. enterica serovar Derby]ECS2865679.1 hypothetical protein [Salmonella enterica subsp. enterica serovar Farmsen]ECT6437316.1 hypothetical protein [Salmonella enterica subsp. enterica]OKK39
MLTQLYIFFRNIYPMNNYYKFFRSFLLEEAIKEASSNAPLHKPKFKKTTICGESSTFCLNYRHHKGLPTINVLY